MGIFYLAIPVGTGAGYLLGGAGSEVRLALSVLCRRCSRLSAGVAVAASSRNRRSGSLRCAAQKHPERDTSEGLVRNPAFLTATLGMAMMTFALGGLQVWMPTFLHRVHGYIWDRPTFFWRSASWSMASWRRCWADGLSDRLLRRTKRAHYLVSAVSLGLGVPAMCVALFTNGRLMIAGNLCWRHFSCC